MSEKPQTSDAPPDVTAATAAESGAGGGAALGPAGDEGRPLVEAPKPETRRVTVHGGTISKRAAAGRGARKTALGVVASDKMTKTLRVKITRLVRHRRYGKYLQRHTMLYVHDEKNEAKEGDVVEVMETRPLSKLKRWRLVRVVTARRA
ncbi:MAG: 30S ribosomal protein S17 [Planctomycetes bacterium]|nr:30S ribosomal protein S17 [Planctomycetota bacterium]